MQRSLKNILTLLNTVMYKDKKNAFSRTLWDSNRVSQNTHPKLQLLCYILHKLKGIKRNWEVLNWISLVPGAAIVNYGTQIWIV